MLATRAWTFQERILPPPIVHCTDKQLYWECRKCYRAEEDLVNWQPDRVRTLPSFAKDIGTSKPWERNPETRKALIQEQLLELKLWYEEIIPTHYSGRKLTYSTDKLVAISGIARAMAPMWEAKYYCGLWSAGLAQALVFLRQTHIKAQPRPAFTYHCPSWSWAAHNFPVNWPLGVGHAESKDVMRVLHGAFFVVDGGDAYGQMRAAYLQVMARTAKLRVKTHERGEDETAPLGPWLVDDAEVPVGWCYLDYDEAAMIREVPLLERFLVGVSRARSCSWYR